MHDGKHCPGCGQDIGIWPVFSAGLPNRIWCPHCKARLTYQGIGGVLVVLGGLLVALLGAGVYAVSVIPLQSRFQYLIVFMGVALAISVVIELMVTMYLRNKKVLKRVD
jgi:hypothetical protein